MFGAGAEFFERGKMLFGAVAFVSGKAVARIGRIELLHHPVTGFLGHNACSGDGEASSVTLDHRPVITGKPLYRESVDQRELGERGERLQCLPYGKVGGAENVQFVDLCCGADADADPDAGHGVEIRQKLGPFLRRKGFGIREALENVRVLFLQHRFRELNRGGDHWSGQWTPSGFIHPGNTKNAAVESGVFGGQQAGVQIEEIR